MNIKLKMVLQGPLLLWTLRRSKKLAKKYKKYPEDYPAQWRNDYALKKAKYFTKLINADIEVKGYENLPKTPSIIVPNHSSSFDPLLIVMALENKDPSRDSVNMQSVFIAKKELATKKNKFRGFFELLDTFMFDRKKPREALRALDEFTDFAKKNRKHAVIFAEGTRSFDGEIQEFKSGAFRSAKKDYMAIVPVTINNALSASDTSRKGRLKVTVIIHPPIKPSSFMSRDNKSIAEHVQKIVKSAWVKPEGKRAASESKLA